MYKFYFSILFLAVSSFSVFSQNLSEDFVKNYNKSAFEFYKQNINKDVNQIFSPFFVNLSFSEIYLATKGGTASQVGDFMIFEEDRTSHYNNFIEFQKIITENNSLNTNFNFSVNLFIEDSLKVLKEFSEKIKPYIVDSVKHFDFTQSADSIVDVLNTYINENSDGHYKDYLSVENIPENSNILINSAAYFSGYWANNFTNFINAPFKSDSVGAKSKNIKYLTSFGYNKYGETEDYQIIELPYEGYQLSLIVILPKKTFSLEQFNQFFNFDYFQLWRQKNMQTQRVRIFLPEFTTESFYDLKSSFDTIIPAIFTKGGNFLNLIHKVVFINGMYHYAKFEVKRENENLEELKYVDFKDEQNENESFIFNANRPFIYLLIHRETEAILYMGHITILR